MKESHEEQSDRQPSEMLEDVQRLSSLISEEAKQITTLEDDLQFEVDEVG